MKQTNALRSMLADMVEVYHRKLADDGEAPEVVFTTNTPHANSHARDCDCDVRGSHVAVSSNVRDTYGKSLDGANELRIIVDTLCHEDAHHAFSDLAQKKEFAEQYPKCPALAGMVQNVLEDQYIDWQRLSAFRGLRGPHSFKVDAIMSNGSRRPPLYNLEQSEQVAEGFLQMAFAGYVKGYSKADGDVQEAIAKCRPLVDGVRNCHDKQAREEIGHAVMQVLLEVIPDPEEADEYTDENSEQMPTDEPADLTEQEKQDLLDELDPEDVADDPEDADQMVEIDTDQHDVPEWLEDELEQAEAEDGQGSAQPEGEDAEEAEQAEQAGGEGSENEDEAQGEDEQQPSEQGEQGEQEDADGAGDGEGEQGDADAPEQDGEQDGEGAGESDTSSEGEQGDSQAGGDDTEGSTGMQGEQGEQNDGAGDAGSPTPSPDQPEATAGEGPDAEDGDASGADPVDDLVADLERKERTRDAGDHWNAGDTEYDSPDDDFQRRYDTIQQEVEQEQTELGQQKRRRRERIEQMQDRGGYERRKDGAEKIRDLLRSDGTADEIVDAFKKFKTDDRWIPDTRGERLNTRNATRRIAGDYSEDRVYDRKKKAEVGDRCVGVALDLSNSMNGANLLRESKLALGALHLATKTIGDDLLATGYKTLDNHPQKGQYEPVLDLITGPTENFEWDHLDGAKSGMYTPTADGVMYTLELLQKSHRREKLMLVVTDGKANISLGGGKSRSQGQEDAKKAVNEARQQGIKVLGMAVGRVGEEYLDEVFGDGQWFHTESDTLTDDLVNLYRGQMRTSQGR